jgi:hypothetical protein
MPVWIALPNMHESTTGSLMYTTVGVLCGMPVAKLIKEYTVAPTYASLYPIALCKSIDVRSGESSCKGKCSLNLTPANISKIFYLN